MNIATIYLGLTSILIVGWLWFYVVRPIVMDIRDGVQDRRASHIMSHRAMRSARSRRRPPLHTSMRYDRRARHPARIPAAPLAAAPDIDAENTGMERITFPRDISDDGLIAYLAVIRKDSKYRFSANAIFTLVGGDRNTVLAKVKEIREGPSRPVYPKLGEDKRIIAA